VCLGIGAYFIDVGLFFIDGSNKVLIDDFRYELDDLFAGLK
jgi:hypothetical protein